MRDLVAAAVALFLLVVALSLATSLHWYRRRHAGERAQLRAQGRSIVAEVPRDDGLVFFTEDDRAFHWHDQVIPKHDLRATRLLVNGAPIAVRRARGEAPANDRDDLSSAFDPSGFERDRWDVAIDTSGGTTLIECGAIRERVSQELARRIFDAVGVAIAQDEDDEQ